MRVLLTGAGGFAGSHCLEHLLVETGWEIVCTDSFRHKGKTDRISGVLDARAEHRGRVTVITHDLTAPFSAQMVSRLGEIDHILAYASESHVDRSITDPVPFITNNVAVALNTLEYARRAKPRSVIWVSTDEVYGPCDDIPFPEWSRIIPSNPYSASKAAQEAIAISYWRTYGVPAIIVNSMNVIGERQDPEKFIPKILRAVLKGEEVVIHGSNGNIGTRHYMHARNLADAILFIAENLPAQPFGTADRPDRFNIAPPDRVGNLELAKMVARIAGKPLRWRLDNGIHRPGHDLHYGLDARKLRSYGWKPPLGFGESLGKTVTWMMAHPEWLEG